MGDGERRAGDVMRLLASGGWADQDPDVLNELLKKAQELASIVEADPSSSTEARAMARNFLDQLEADTLT